MAGMEHCVPRFGRNASNKCSTRAALPEKAKETLSAAPTATVDPCIWAGIILELCRNGHQDTGRCLLDALN